MPLLVAYATLTGALAALDIVTVKTRSRTPLSPSLTEASAMERPGRTGSVPTGMPLTVRSVAAVPPLPGVAWKPNEVDWPAPTWPFHDAFLTT